jgi:putative phosphoribosyl transferase
MVTSRSNEDARIRTDASLSDRTRVFRDRLGAGARLARLLAPDLAPDAVVFGLAPGGVPVAYQVARFCRLPLEVAVAAPVAPPWSHAPAYGAVAWDGTAQFDAQLREVLALDRREAARALEAAYQQVAAATACRNRPLPVISDRPVVLVDDGAAPTIVVEAAVAALRNAGAGPLWLALAAQTRRSVQRLAAAVDRVYCVNLHFSCRFEAAHAYLELPPLGLSEAVAMTRASLIGSPVEAVTGVSASGPSAE